VVVLDQQHFRVYRFFLSVEIRFQISRKANTRRRPVSVTSEMGRHLPNHSPSPDRGRRRRRSPPPEERSPTRHRSSGGETQRSSRARSSKRETSRSPPVKERRPAQAKSSPRRERSGSPSPRSKRLSQVAAEKEADRRTDRDHGRNHGREKDRVRDREGSKVSEREHERKERSRDRVSDKGNRAERKERSYGRDEMEEKPSRVRHGRSASPSDRRQKSRRRSHSPEPSAENRQHDDVADRRNDEDDSVAKMKAAEEALEAKKQKPSFELSGKLAAETNRFRGITLLFNEPPEARKPNIRWRLYVFKGGEVLNEPLYIHRQSCYLFGRERRVADIPTDHPSCSKQHAVIQFRQIEKEEDDGTISKQVRPYVMDLGSTNKTFINENPIEPQRYYELFERDTIKFGNSSREYVLLHENSSEA
ncbi:FHA domain-containing protein DDL, partial [Linum grandiflorum]